MFKFLQMLRKTRKVEELGCEGKSDLPESMHTGGGDEVKLKDRGKLFIGGLNFKTNTAALEAHFSCFGKVIDAVVMRFPDTKRSRGYGFVTFADPSVADSLEGQVQILDGNRIDIRRFTSKSTRILEKRVFLGGLPFGIAEEKLKIFFSRYGEVENVEIPRNPGTDKGKGYAFLTFKDKDAAEHCQADQFVYLEGKRVHIEKALPKYSTLDSATPDSLAVGEKKQEKEFKPKKCSSDDVESASDDDSQSLSSGPNAPKNRHATRRIERKKILDTLYSTIATGDQASLAGFIPGFQELMQNYYKEKMSLFNQTKENRKEKDGNGQPRESDIMEMEKLLTMLLINSSEDKTEEKMIDFSDTDTSGSDEDITDTEDSQKLIGEDKDCDRVPWSVRNPNLDFLTSLYKPNTGSEETLWDKLIKEKEKSSYKKSDFILSQRSTVPFKVEDGAGCCSLCSWISTDGSTENLLSHYKTPAHQLKLKERFLQTKQIDNDELDIHSKLLSTQKTFNMTDEGEYKKQCNVQTDKKKKNKEPDQKPKQQEQQQQKEKKHRSRRKKTKPDENQPDNLKEKFHSENDTEWITSNPKFHAIAKGMLFIQPTSENNLSCKMCNKIIPQAKDFGTLMKNVTAHLQSKRHLSKLSEVEDLLKSQTSKNVADKGKETEKNVADKRKETEKKVADKGKETEKKVADKRKETEKNVADKRKETEKKVADKGKETEKKVADKRKETEKKVENPKQGVPGPGETGTAPKSGKEKTDKKKPEKDKTTETALFLCLICNFFGSNTFKINLHLSSTSHKEACKSSDATYSLELCESCKRYLYGSLYDINKHHSKCLRNKN